MSKLEKVTCIFLIVVCILSISVLVRHEFFTTNAATGPDMNGQAAMLVGKSEPSVLAMAWESSQRNVVLLLSSRCHFCAESMPLYRQLSFLRQQGQFSLLVVGLEDSKSLAAYVHQNGVDANCVFRAPSGFAGITFTPAVFIVDSRGVIQKAFLGKLGAKDAARLLHLVG